jgi:hypothetical protein
MCVRNGKTKPEAGILLFTKLFVFKGRQIRTELGDFGWFNLAALSTGLGHRMLATGCGFSLCWRNTYSREWTRSRT